MRSPTWIVPLHLWNPPSKRAVLFTESKPAGSRLKWDGLTNCPFLNNSVVTTIFSSLHHCLLGNCSPEKRTLLSGPRKRRDRRRLVSGLAISIWGLGRNRTQKRKPQKAMYPKVCTANQTIRSPYRCCLPNSSACYNSLNSLEDVTFRAMPNHLAGPEVRLEIMEARIIVYVWNSASLSDLTEL